MLYSCTLFSFQLSAIKITSSLTLACAVILFLLLFTIILQGQRQEHFGDLRRHSIQDSSGQTGDHRYISSPLQACPATSLMMPLSLALLQRFRHPPLTLNLVAVRSVMTLQVQHILSLFSVLSRGTQSDL